MAEVSSLIQYKGVQNYTPDKLSSFNEKNIDFHYTLDPGNPGIGEIVKVWIETQTFEEKVIQTIKETSLEGQRCTGFKLMMLGSIYYKVEYIADEKEQRIFTAEGEIPFGGSVVLPENTNDHSVVHAGIIVEDIYTEKIDERNTYNNVTLLIIADIS